ncbi:MAG: exodeoxyribonuclease III [Planctomycetota bacterium]
MKIATWNVNSVRARLPRLLAWLEERRPDVVCLQELKCLDEQFPREPLEDLGYNVETYGQKTYNGVAILAKKRLEDVVRGFPEDPAPAQHRVLGATVGDFLLLCVYVVNGQEVGSEAYELKRLWMERLAAHVKAHYDMAEKVIVAGDFNITFDDRDVYNPEEWREQILCTSAEREWLAHLIEPGLHDALRKFTQEGGIYTWWDYRTGAFRRNHGLRLDHFLMSRPALAACTVVEVDVEARRGEKASDHAPVVATFESP